MHILFVDSIFVLLLIIILTSGNILTTFL